jgi:hypothetical protein
MARAAAATPLERQEQGRLQGQIRIASSAYASNKDERMALAAAATPLERQEKARLQSSRWHCWVAGGWFAMLAPPLAVAPLPCVLRCLTATRVQLRVDLATCGHHDCFFVCVAQALFGDGALGQQGALAAAVAALRTMQRSEQQQQTPTAERAMWRQLCADEHESGGWAVPVRCQWLGGGWAVRNAGLGSGSAQRTTQVLCRGQR